MKFFSLLSILFMLKGPMHGQKPQLLDFCLGKFGLQHCETSPGRQNKLWNLYAELNNHFTVSTQAPCANLGFHFNWSILSLNDGVITRYGHYKKRSILFVDANSLTPSTYLLQLIISHTRTSKKKSFMCLIRLQSRPVIASIRGATTRNSYNGEVITLDASSSCKNGHSIINYTWTCRYTSNRPEHSVLADILGGGDDEDEDPCKNVTRHGEVINVAVEGRVGSTFEWELIMEAGTSKSKAKQVIKLVDDLIPIIDIVCSQNCPETGVYRMVPLMEVRLQATCRRFCDLVDKYHWFTARFQNASSYGDKRSMYYFKEVAATAQYVLPPYKRERNTSCNWNPNLGSNLITLFHAKCPPIRDIVSYKIVEFIDDDLALTLSRSAVPEFDIRFSTFTAYYPAVQMKDALMTTTSENSVYVDLSAPTPRGFDNVRRLADDIYNKVSLIENPSDLGKEGRVWEAVQIINALMPRLRAIQTKNAQNEYIKLSTMLLRDILSFPTEMVLDSLIMVLPRLMVQKDEPRLRDYTIALSNACQYFAKKRINDVATKNNTEVDKTETAAEYKVFQMCVRCLTSSNYYKSDIARSTTPPPFETNRAVFEEYESYEDTVSDYMKEEFIKITNSIIETAKLASMLRTLMSDYGEEPLNEQTEFFQFDKGKAIERVLEMDSCKIELPENIGIGGEEKVRLLINTFNESLFFWDTNEAKLSTRLLNMRFLDEHWNEITKLPEMANIYFKISQASAIKLEKVNVDLSPGELIFKDTNIPVFRIEMRMSSNIMLVLKNIIEPLKMVVLQGRRPLVKDFKRSQLITTGPHFIEIKSAKKDVYLFVALLPAAAVPEFNDDEAEILDDNLPHISRIIMEQSVLKANETLLEVKDPGKLNISKANFSLGVLVQQCVEWMGDDWYQSSCQLGQDTTEDVIQCQCYSLTNVAAFSYEPNIKKRNVLVLNIVLKFTPNYVPYYMVISVIALYCTAMCYAVIRRGIKVHVYYLGDNVPEHNFAYLLIVKTSDRISSGTLADIVIKVHGRESSSRPHVLNYPDPDQNLLQKGNVDIFILTSDEYLGELTRIELWSDCMSIRPAWNCDYVKICDLQKKKWYIFDVENVFLPLRYYTHYVFIIGDEISADTHRDVTWDRVLRSFYWRVGAEHTWNIFLRKDDASLGYVERITILLSHILTAYAVVLYMSLLPTFTNTDAIYDNRIMNVAPILQYSILSSSVTFPVNRAFVFVFRNLTRKKGRWFYYEKKLLPEYVKYFCWLLLFGVITVSFLYVMFMGVGISVGCSYTWLIITSLSLVISIFLWENLYLGFAQAISLISKTTIVYDYNAIIKAGLDQKAYLKEILPENTTLRPYLDHLYRPMSRHAYITRRKEIAHRFKIAKTFREFLAFLLYFLLLYLLVALNQDPHSIYFNVNLREMMEGVLSDTKLDDVKDMNQYIKYLNETFVNVVHGYRWYGNYTIKDPGLMPDFQSKVLGIARIRQKRVLAIPCLAGQFCADVFGITKCAPTYSHRYQDTRNFSETESLWKFHQPWETGVTVHYGEFATYYGGGYITHVARNLENAYYNIREVVEQNWLNKYTRAVFIEFWVYNANRNLFSTVTVAAEFSPTGYIHRSYKINTVELMFSGINKELLTIIVFSMYCVLMVYQLGNIASKIFYQGSKFWKNLVNWSDTLIWIGSAAVIVMFMYKQKIVDNILDQLARNKENEFTQYFPAINYSEVVTMLIAILLGVSVMGTWRFLRFGFVFKVFERSVKTQTAPLLSAFLYSFVVYIQFTIICYLLFGPYTYVFKTFPTSITTLSLLGLSMYDKYNHDEVGIMLPIFSKLFYTLFRLSLLYFLKVYITIITLHYEDSKRYVSHQERQFSILNYFIEECKYFFAYIKKKKKYLAGGMERSNRNTLEEEIKVRNKFNDDDQCSGVVFVPSNKLELMAIMLFASMHNEYAREDPDILTHEDFELMRSIVWYHRRIEKGERLAYYQMRINKERSHFVGRNTLNEMATIANGLFFPLRKEPKRRPDKVSLKRLNKIGETLKVVDKLIQNISIVNSSDDIGKS